LFRKQPSDDAADLRLGAGARTAERRLRYQDMQDAVEQHDGDHD
jgi:hypothetical protein